MLVSAEKVVTDSGRALLYEKAKQTKSFNSCKNLRLSGSCRSAVCLRVTNRGAVIVSIKTQKRNYERWFRQRDGVLTVRARPTESNQSECFHQQVI